jgi:glycosyltransferase involved in cell wall biosynthesis
MKFEVSIIVPVYQVEKYIEACAISICNQTFKNIEVILVNDGTKDNSISIAESIFLKNNVSYRIINKENSGLPSARNSGFREANGEWVISIDSDDVLNESFIESLVSYAKKTKVNIGFCDLQTVTLSNIAKKPLYNNGIDVYDKDKFQQLFLKRSIVPVVATMILKKQWLIDNDLYLNEECFFGGDQNFIWKASFYLDKILHVKIPLYNYLERPNSIITAPNLQKVINGYECMCSLVKDMSIFSNDNRVLEFIIPRWLFGTLRTISKNGSFDMFTYLSDYSKAEEKMYVLYKFPDIRIRILAKLFILKRRFFYNLNHRKS